MWLILLLSSLVLLGYIALLKIVAWRRLVKRSAAIPTLSGWVPVMGHVQNLLQSKVKIAEFVDGIQKETRKRGGITTMWIGPLPTYLITDPDDALTLSNACLKKPYIYNFLDAWLGNVSLLYSLPHKWRAQRKQLNTFFNQRYLNGFLEVFNEQAAMLVNMFEPHVGGEAFDFKHYLVDNTLDTIKTNIFGRQEDTVGQNKYAYKEAIEDILNILMKRFSNILLHSDLLYKFTKSKGVEDKAVYLLQKTASDALIKVKSAVASEDQPSDKNFKPFVSLMLELLEDGSLSEAEIQQHLDTFLFGGHDTSATQLMYIFMAIGHYPEIQERIYKELKEVLGDTPRAVTKEDLPKLVYLTAVIKETMRLYPIGPVVMRDVDRDVKLKNVTLPSGTFAFILISGINRSGVWGADADQFDPGRWLEPTRLPASPAAFATFSVGKRDCIGKTYAMMSMKTTIAHILQHYRLKADINQLKCQLDVMLKPQSGCELSVELRRTMSSN